MLSNRKGSRLGDGKGITLSLIKGLDDERKTHLGVVVKGWVGSLLVLQIVLRGSITGAQGSIYIHVLPNF